MEVADHFTERIARVGKLQQGEFKEGLIVRLELDLSAQLQHLPVPLQKAPVGQPALGLALGRPGIAEVDINRIHLVLGKVVRQQRGVAHHKKHIAGLGRNRSLHGHHQGVRYLLNADEQYLRGL